MRKRELRLLMGAGQSDHEADWVGCCEGGTYAVGGATGERAGLLGGARGARRNLIVWAWLSWGRGFHGGGAPIEVKVNGVKELGWVHYT